MYELRVGDYIEFTRIIRPAKKGRWERGSLFGTHWIHEIPEAVINEPGSGRIEKIGKDRKIGDDRFRVARVATGAWMGVVTAVLDDAVLIGKQMTLEVGNESAPEHGPSVYGTDGRIA